MSVYEPAGPAAEAGNSAAGEAGLLSPKLSMAFGSVEELEDSNAEADWDVSYRQLQSGAIDTTAHLRELNGVTLLEEQVDRRLEGVGQAPDGHVAIILPCENTLLRLNGLPADHTSVALYEPGSAFHVVTSDSAHVLSLHLPVQLLRDAAGECAIGSIIPDGRTMAVINAGTGAAERFRRSVLWGLDQTFSERGAEQRGVELAEHLAGILGGADEDRTQTKLEILRRRRRIIKVARDYIEANLDETIRIGHLCAHCDTVISTLERTFQIEMGMTPSQYILARRLEAVHRDLKALRNQGGQVSRVAMDYGFSHLGRFSAAYRDFFGELPSETLSSG